MAEKAADWGLIWKAAEDANLMAEASKLAAGPTPGLGLTKGLVRAAATNSPDEQLHMERDLQQKAGRSSDCAEGVTAFLEKRRAWFTGK